VLSAIQEDFNCETVVCGGAPAPLEMTPQLWAGAGMDMPAGRAQGPRKKGVPKPQMHSHHSHSDFISSANYSAAAGEVLLIYSR